MMHESKKFVKFQLYILIVLEPKPMVENFIDQDLLPSPLFTSKCIQTDSNYNHLAALFDRGGIVSFIHEQVLMPESIPFTGPILIFTTVAGEFQVNLKNKFSYFNFPQTAIALPLSSSKMAYA